MGLAMAFSSLFYLCHFQSNICLSRRPAFTVFGLCWNISHVPAALFQRNVLQLVVARWRKWRWLESLVFKRKEARRHSFNKSAESAVVGRFVRSFKWRRGFGDLVRFVGALLFPAYVWWAALLLVAGLIFFKWLTFKWFSYFLSGWWKGLGLSLLAQGLAGLTACLLWLAMEQPGPPGLLILAFFVANLASVLPVTFGGIGLREWVFIQFAGPHLMSYLWVALCFTGIHTLVSLAGAFIGNVEFEEGGGS